jgi:TRAP-type C4-dicarboxylate transport system permease small subunit
MLGWERINRSHLVKCPMNIFEKVINHVSRWGVVAAGAFLVAIMIAIVLDIVLRLARIPIIGSYEITQLFIVVTVAFALPYTALKKGHVVVDLLVSRLKERSRTISSVITIFLSLVIWGLVVWASVGVLEEKWTREASFTLQIPYLPFRFAWVIGLALFCLVYLLEVIKGIMSLGKSKWTR